MSVSTTWALADRWQREQIEKAHTNAVEHLGPTIMSPCRLRVFELHWTDDKAQPNRSPSHTRVERDETTTEESRQRHVVRVVGLGPTQLLGDIPCFLSKPTRLVLSHGSRKYAVPASTWPARGAAHRARAWRAD